METKTVIKDAAEAWIGLKLAKGASRLIGPLAVAGVGYYLYKRFIAKDSSLVNS